MEIDHVTTETDDRRITAQLGRVLAWYGWSRIDPKCPSFWAEFSVLAELYNEIEGGYEEFT
jgi:hypothetical protein